MCHQLSPCTEQIPTDSPVYAVHLFLNNFDVDTLFSQLTKFNWGSEEMSQTFDHIHFYCTTFVLKVRQQYIFRLEEKAETQ